MDIEQFLKENNARLTYEDKWLVWSDAWCIWHVYQAPYHRKAMRIYDGDKLDKALEALSGMEGV